MAFLCSKIENLPDALPKENIQQGNLREIRSRFECRKYENFP